MKEITLTELKKIFASADLYDLILEGAPIDEYDSEAEIVYDEIQNNNITNPEELIERTELIFKKMFWESFTLNKSKQEELRSLILNFIKSNKLSEGFLDKEAKDIKEKILIEKIKEWLKGLFS